MGRPESKTVEYFPFYVKDGDTLFLLESKYGCEGLGFFTAVLRFLSQTPDHHYCIKDPVKRMRFFAKAHIDEERGMEMLELMAVTGKINRVLWNGNKVIVSEDFLNSVEEAYKKRKNEIVTIDQIYKFYGLKGAEKRLSEEETGIPQRKGDGNTQSKVKESKGKEIKEKTAKKPYGEFGKVRLTEEEFEKLLSRHGRVKTDLIIEKLDSFKESKGRKYTSDYGAINSWVSRSVDEDIEKNPKILTSKKIEKAKPPPEKPKLNACPKCGGACKSDGEVAVCRECTAVYERHGNEWIFDVYQKDIQGIGILKNVIGE